MKIWKSAIPLSLLLPTLALALCNENLAGFSVVLDNAELMQLDFQGRETYVISKKRFAALEDAKKFCSDLKLGGVGALKLDEEFGILLMAMSGLASANAFVADAITFEIKNPDHKVSGIWAWSGQGSGDQATVTIMYDGHGTDEDRIPISEINQVMKLELPAICTEISH